MSLKLINNRGCLYLVGEYIDDIANSYLKHVPKNFIDYRSKEHGESFHITVTTVTEKAVLKQINVSEHEILCSDIVDLGVGQINDSYYVVIMSNKLKELRTRYSLPDIHFHITLGYNQHDGHTKSKNIETLIIPNFSLDK